MEAEPPAVTTEAERAGMAVVAVLVVVSAVAWVATVAAWVVPATWAA